VPIESGRLYLQDDVPLVSESRPKPEDRTYQSLNGPCDPRGFLGHPRLARTSMRTRRDAASGWIPLRLDSELRKRFVLPLKPKVIARHQVEPNEAEHARSGEDTMEQVC
jgi:hypothetical protein